METLLDQFIYLARKELGVSEKNNPDRILHYNDFTNLRARNVHTPWCSSFLNFIVSSAGCISTRSAAAKSWLTWGEEIEEPIRGCIAVLKRTEDPRFGHTGLFNFQNGNLINILGGDQDESVCYANFSASKLISYRVPLGFKPNLSLN